MIPPELLKHFARSKSVTVLTGAGVSAESGVPTFRDAQTGLWAKYNPEDLATPRAFRRNPRLVYPTASLPFEALRSGATVIEINPQPTPFTDKAHFVLNGPAGVVLPELLTLIKS